MIRPGSSVGRAEPWKGLCRRFDSVPGHHDKWLSYSIVSNQQINSQPQKSVVLQIRYTQKGNMASIRKHYKKYQVLIRRKGHPLICKSFATYSDATFIIQKRNLKMMYLNKTTFNKKNNHFFEINFLRSKLILSTS